MRLSMVPRKVAAQATVTLKTPDGEHKIEVVSAIDTCGSLHPAGMEAFSSCSIAAALSRTCPSIERSRW